MKIYVYADLLNKYITMHTCNFWGSPKAKETGLYASEKVAFQLLEVREIDLSAYNNYDFTPGKIDALERELANLHVKTENIKSQIQELKAIGHEGDLP